MRKRRLISTLAALSMTVCMVLPTTVYATGAEEAYASEQTSEDREAAFGQPGEASDLGAIEASAVLD